ncbi:MAG: type II toxin-antitoxin system VapC family toxin [Thermomicrobiales bacterium]
MRYLVDTDWVIDAFIGIRTAQRTLDELSAEGIGVSIVTYGEIFEGAFGDPDPSARLALFRTHLATFQLVPLTPDVMENFGRIRALLRRHRQLIPDGDLQIAATALTLDLTLLTRNRRHFDRVPGLKLY